MTTSKSKNKELDMKKKKKQVPYVVSLDGYPYLHLPTRGDAVALIIRLEAEGRKTQLSHNHRIEYESPC